MGETKERESAELEIEHLTHELVATTEQEKKDRERDVATLKNQITALRHELSGEKEGYASDLALCKRGLGTLEAQQTWDVKDLRHAIESEASARMAANDRLDTACTDLRVSIEVHRASQNAATKDLETAITKHQQAIDVKIRERSTVFEEHNRSINDMRQAI